MQKIVVLIYRFSELSDWAKVRALDFYRYININSHDWKEEILYDLISSCKRKGIIITDLFFDEQREALSFKVKIDIIDLIKTHNKLSARTSDTETLFIFSELDVPHDILNFLSAESITCNVSIIEVNNKKNISIENNLEYSNSINSKFKNIHSQLDFLTQWITNSLKEMGKYIFDLLINEYNSLISDDIVKEAIEINDYLFIHDGSSANKIIKFPDTVIL